MTWHVDQDVLDRYQFGTLDRVASASLEAHVTSCGQCRSMIAFDSAWVYESWRRIADRVQPSETSVVERVLCWVGVPPHLARVVSVTPSLRPAWLLGVAFTLAFAGIVSQVAVPGSIDLFLAVAPLVPVAGVAVAYGRVGDTAHEITAATPVDPILLLLLRTAAVTVFAFVLSLIFDVVFSATRETGLWILPALALTLGTLALGAHVSMWLAGVTSAGVWVLLLAVFGVRPEGSLDVVFSGSAQVGFAAVAFMAGIVFLHDRDAYRRGEMQ
jgi:hypothetical protein